MAASAGGVEGATGEAEPASGLVPSGVASRGGSGASAGLRLPAPGLATLAWSGLGG